IRHGRQRSRSGSSNQRRANSTSLTCRVPSHATFAPARRRRLAVENTRRPTADPAASDDDGEEEAMDHRENGALEAARARRGDLHRALLDLERALAGAARGRAQAWADSVRATLVRVRKTFTAHI